MQDRNAGIPADLLADQAGRPLSARSAMASALLGTEGLALPVRSLVRVAELFGFAEGTARVALSRMATAGEVAAGDGLYRLTGRLVDRARAQESSRHPQRHPWKGDWQLAVVTAERRPATERVALRAALRHLRLGEWREGVWARPDNLGRPDRLPEAARTAGDQCAWLSAQLHPANGVGADPVAADRALADRALAGRLWDLEGWAGRAARLHDAMATSIGGLHDHDTAALRPCFDLATVVLRHVSADPLLPDELLPPAWPGAVLRAGYDAYEKALQTLLREWFRRE